MPKIAIQGERGSYSEAAALSYFKDAEIITCDTFEDAFGSVGKSADHAFVPIENSIEGVVTQVCDLLLRKKLFVFGEGLLRIRHCLIANKGVRINDIKKVYSHPQALAQSRKYLEKIGAELIPFSDTAKSVMMIKEKRMMDSAGVAGAYAARLYGMNILRRNLESHSNNTTRFFAITDKDIKPEKRAYAEDMKTSLGIIVKNAPGSLYRALGSLAENGIDITYLQSRPVPGKPGRSAFYMECRGSAYENHFKDAINDLRKHSESVREMGSYRKGRGFLNNPKIDA